MRFIVILLVSCIFSQELEVQGDLRVTGTIHNDSLMLVIANLQAQIVSLQAQLAAMQVANKLETRMFEINNYTTSIWEEDMITDFIDFSQLVGFQIEYGIIEIIDIELISEPDGNDEQFVKTAFITPLGYFSGITSSPIYPNKNITNDRFGYVPDNEYWFASINENININVKLSITTQFPE